MKKTVFNLKVSMAFQDKLPVEKLNPEEQQAHAKMLWQALEDLDGSDDSFLQEMQENGGTVYGIDENGNMRKK